MQLASYTRVQYSTATSFFLLAAARDFNSHGSLRSSTPVQLQARAYPCSQRGHTELRM